MGIADGAERVAEESLKALAERRQGALRSEVARLKTELAIIREALPNPERLLQVALVLDKLIPEDPNPAMQEYLKVSAEQISAIRAHSGVGKDGHELIQLAIKYADLVLEYRRSVSVGASRGILVNITKQINEQVDNIVDGADNMRQYLTTSKGESDVGPNGKDNRQTPE